MRRYWRVETRDQRNEVHVTYFPIRDGEDRRLLIEAAKVSHVEWYMEGVRRFARANGKTPRYKHLTLRAKVTEVARPSQTERQAEKRRKDRDAARAVAHNVGDVPRTKKESRTMSNNKYIGVALVGDEKKTGPSRATTDGAENAVKKEHPEAEAYQVVKADSAVKAKQLANFSLVEPTEAELAEAAAAARKPKAPAVPPAVAQWWVAERNSEGDAVLRDGPFAVQPSTQPDMVVVEATSEDEARSRVDAVGTEEPLPESLPLRLRKPLDPNRFGTEPIKTDVWYVATTGTIHGDPDCRFVRKQVAAGTAGESHDRQLVKKVQDRIAELEVDQLRGPQSLTTKGTDNPVRDYCRFCAVVKPEPAEVAVS